MLQNPSLISVFQSSIHDDTLSTYYMHTPPPSPQGHDICTQVGLYTAAQALKQSKMSLLNFKGQSIPHQVSVSSTSQSHCIVLHLKIKEHFELWHLVSQQRGWLHEHLQRSFINHCSVYVNTARN